MIRSSAIGAWVLSFALVVSVPGCARNARPPKVSPPAAPRLRVETIAAAIPGNVKDRRTWAEAIVAALDAIGKTPAREPVCAVLAVIEQESGFVANPTVANLPRIIDAKLDAIGRRLGPLGRPAVNRLLEGRVAGKPTFAQRLQTVKTERDVDLVFRDLVDHYRERFPRTAATATVIGAIAGADVDDLNPITTAGSMQVSVRFAAALGAPEGFSREQVRDELYSIRGGVRYGTARLFAYEAGYERYIYRFADYNAGMYASRNAALQEQVALLIGAPLALDGDLLAYDKSGNILDADTKSLAALLAFRKAYAAELSERQVRREVRLEKSQELEATGIYRAVKRVFADRRGRHPSYARLPDVALQSPKLSRQRSTAWFAENVDRRFRTCLSRIPPNAR